MDLTRDEFESLVSDAIDGVPAPFDAALARVPVIVVDQPPHPGLLGRYTGVPLPERAGGEPLWPSVIEVFMYSLIATAGDLDELREQVRITVLHELGHHLGMDEDDLDRLGYR